MAVQERLRGSGRFSNSESEVQQDSLVCLRASPIYTAGTKAIFCRGHKLQVSLSLSHFTLPHTLTPSQCGILQESVFSSSMSEKCRFRVVTAKEVLPEVTGSKVAVSEGDSSLPSPHLGVKRRYHDDVGGREELWSLHDVIFTDRVQAVRVGRVVKVDGLFAAVHFPGRSEGLSGDDRMDEGVPEGEQVALDQCRLLRKDDLVVSQFFSCAVT